MKVIFNFNLSAWMKGVQVDAGSVEEAEEKLRGMTLEDMLEYGFVKDMDIKDVDSEVGEYSFKAKVSDIEYDVDEDDLAGTGMTMEEFIGTLPTDMEVTIDGCAKEDDEESMISDELTDQTNMIVSSFSYSITDRF